MANDMPHFPRFMTDAELRAYFGLSERALRRLRMTGGFPKRDALIGRTDSKVVDLYFDQRSGLPARFTTAGMAYVDGIENFD